MTGSKHIRWAFNLANWQPKDPEQIRRAFARIQSEEIDRLMKFVFLDDLKASLVGRLMIRSFVAKATGERNSAIRIERDERGKPYYAAPNHKLDFNVSHQGGYTVLAGYWMARDNTTSSINHQSEGTNNRTPVRLGIDVMKMEYTGGKRIEEFFRLMDRNFTASEWSYIKSGSSRTDQIGRFMRVWCLKESYVKNVGVGITVDLRQIDFVISRPLDRDPRNTVCLSTKVKLNGCTDAEDDWHFEETLLDDEHCVAVAINGPPTVADPHGVSNCTERRFQFIDIKWLIDGLDPVTSEKGIKEDLCIQVLQKDEKR